MRFSANVPRLLKLIEGVRLVAYLDTGGVPTNGVGHTRGVELGQTVDMATVDEWLRQDLMVVDAFIKQLVTVNLTQGQIDALGLFGFNIGQGQFARSTLLRRLNAGQKVEARKELRRWCHDEGNVILGLQVRRTAEAFVWEGHASEIDEDWLEIMREALR